MVGGRFCVWGPTSGEEATDDARLSSSVVCVVTVLAVVAMRAVSVVSMGVCGDLPDGDVERLRVPTFEFEGER